MFLRISLLLALLITSSIAAAKAVACPFCAAVSQTFGEEIDSMDVVVFAVLKHAPNRPSLNGNEGELAKSKFEIKHVLKGEKVLGDTKVIEQVYYGDGSVGKVFLLMATDPPKLMWTTPTLLNAKAQAYLLDVIKLPAEPSKRLLFFKDYLEHKEQLLSADAYDEFAKTPFNAIKMIKSDLDHGQLIEWIKNTDVPANRRRLYLTLLSVCGSKKDAPLLEGLLRSEDRKQKAGLDALIGAYLTIMGADGMPLIEELFLKNKKAEYADTYAAIMAIRFHGTETDVIPRKRLLTGLHHMLDRPELADLVIVDLARWEDWTVMPRLVTLFKDADEKSSWVRVPVVRYLMACPLPEAKVALKEVTKVDAQAVKRAQTFFPASGGSSDGDAKESDDSSES